MITIAADQYLNDLASWLPETVNLSLYDPGDGLPDLKGVNGLLVRTVTAVNAETLPAIPDSLSFIGTGSSGTDHVDRQYLEANNITFADAAGCNARSVAEYVTTGLLLWSEETGESLQNLSIGIVGVGHVGRKVQRQLERLDIPTIGYDPPRAGREPGFCSATLDEVLDADILTFHTPLTSAGRHSTFHWLNADKLSTFNLQLVINTARGGVIDEQALLKAYEDGTVKNFILDVWEREPGLNPEIAERAFIKTPHIAGYSIQAKQNASKMIADALLKHFGLKGKKNPPSRKPKVFTAPVGRFSKISGLLTELHPIKEYENRLSNILETRFEERGSCFNRLRAEFPLRKEFGNIRLPESYFERFPSLKKLGFGLIGESK